MSGTDCNPLEPIQRLSGAWYNLERNGEGFIVEVQENGTAVVYWFTYQPDEPGAQAWMFGVGPI